MQAPKKKGRRRKVDGRIQYNANQRQRRSVCGMECVDCVVDLSGVLLWRRRGGRWWLGKMDADPCGCVHTSPRIRIRQEC